MHYLLSIVIPTRNRQKYCMEAVKQIAGLHIEKLQLVIQDNSNTQELEKSLEIIDADIKYHFHPGELSFVDNFNEALSLADGEYICMIGDDDGVLPDIMDVVRMAVKERYDAVIPGLNSVYCWPSDKPFIKNAEGGYLCLSYLKNEKVDIECREGLKKLMEKAGQNYQSLELPRLYHGIVSREAINRVKEKNGVFFKGLTPDIYMTVALCFVCSKVCRISYPVTVSGICPRSGSSDSATGKHTGRLQDAPHFRGHVSYTWDPKAPEIYSVESIWAETAMQALHDFDAETYYQMFRVDILDGICLQKYPQFSVEITKHAKENGIMIGKMRIQMFWLDFTAFIKRLFKRIKRKKGDVIKYYNVSDIQAACRLTVNEMEKIL